MESLRAQPIQHLLCDSHGETGAELTATVAIDPASLIRQVGRIGDDQIERALRPGEHVALRDVRDGSVQR